MASRYHSRAGGLVVMFARCDACGRRVELFADVAWHGLKRRLSARHVYCDGCVPVDEDPRSPTYGGSCRAADHRRRHLHHRRIHDSELRPYDRNYRRLPDQLRVLFLMSNLGPRARASRMPRPQYVRGTEAEIEGRATKPKLFEFL